MNKTNKGLVAHCENALKEGWYYLWGTYAQKATQSVIDSNIKQYPSNEAWRSYASKAIGKTRVCDCYGLVKSYLWWVDDNSNPKYNNVHDHNTTEAYGAANEKGPLATLPEIPGIIMYMPGHVGIYIGSGRFIECRGGGVGMYEGKITTGKITKGSKFTHWFKDINIEYATTTAAAPNTHRVVAGDTLSKIALAYGTTIASLKSINGIANPSLIKAGQIIMLNGSVEAAIEKLAAIGVINSAAYWTANYKNLAHMGTLLKNAAKVINKKGIAKATVEAGINALVSAGVISDKDYWMSNYVKVTHLGNLLKALGGCV